MSPSCDEKDNLEQFVSSGRWWSIQRSDIAILSIYSPILLMGLKPSFIYDLLFLCPFSSWTGKKYKCIPLSWHIKINLLINYILHLNYST